MTMNDVFAGKRYLWVTFCLLGWLWAGGGAWAQADAKKAEQSLKDFKKFYANNNEHVRRAAVEDLGNCDHPSCVPALLKAFGDSDPKVKAAVVPALRKQTTPAAAHALNRELAKSRDLELQLAILDVFRVTKPPVAYDTILKLADKGKFETQIVAAELLGIYPSDEKKSQRLLLERLEDKNPQMRLVAIDALVKLKHPELVDICLDLLNTEKDWRVKASALAALPAYREKRTISPLIKVMETEENRLVDDAHRALIDITGESYPLDAKRWRKWWTKVEKRFKVPTVAQLKERREKLAKAMAAYSKIEKEKPPYHGISTKSRRMLFIIDVSYSMRDKIVVSVKDPEKAKEFREKYRGAETKIDLARESLIEYVATLEPYVKFNIILFNSVVKTWKPRLVAASSGNRNSAIKMLSRLNGDWLEQQVKQDRGGTNSFGALNLALGLKDKPQKKPSKTHKVEGDTVFFLTDGMPETGLITDPNELLQYVLNVNKRAKIVFHTITFGHGNEVLLKELAIKSGGQYVVISGE